MTYNATEISMQDGSPIELYEFRHGTQYYRYTSADEDIVFLSQTYTSQPALRRSTLEATPEQARNALTIDCARNLGVADLYRVTPPSEPIILTLREYHELDGDAEAAIIWIGRVLSLEWVGSGATIRCEPVSTSLKRTGLRRLYQRQCPHVLYGAGCNVNRELFGLDATVTSISADGRTITATEFASAPFPLPGGYLRLEIAAGTYERRYIQAHSGSSITLSQQVQQLDPSDSVRVYAGCDHTMTTCLDVFANLDNYGGFPFIPGKNPFGSDPVY